MEEQKVQSTCMRCHRKLTDPVSVRRGIGPICWALCNGDVFEKDLEASDEEWARREKLLKDGGEIDFGVNWEYPIPGDMLPARMRVSVRYRDGQFEAYGAIFKPEGTEEVVFARSSDLRAVYAEAVKAGPTANAAAYAAQKAAARTWKAQQKKRGVA